MNFQINLTCHFIVLFVYVLLCHDSLYSFGYKINSVFSITLIYRQKKFDARVG